MVQWQKLGQREPREVRVGLAAQGAGLWARKGFPKELPTSEIPSCHPYPLGVRLLVCFSAQSNPV